MERRSGRGPHGAAPAPGRCVIVIRAEPSNVWEGALAGRTAIVTGGGTGVGEAVASMLAERGARVCVTGRRAGPIEALAARHERIEARVCEATDERATSALVDELRPDIAVANAGMASSAPFTRITRDELRALWDVNLIGVHALFAAVLRGRGDRGETGAGRLIAIASTAGLRGYPYVAGYVAAKHAVVGLCRALALELAAKEATRAVTVNAVCPGYTETPMLRATVENIMAKTGRDREAAEAPLKALNPQGRFVEPSEVADAVAWLAGDGAGSINGQAISVSGGETM